MELEREQDGSMTLYTATVAGTDSAPAATAAASAAPPSPPPPSTA
jgi:hypothetical protein